MRSSQINKIEMLAPVRSKELSKPKERGVQLTPDFDKKKPLAQASPIGKTSEKENKTAGKAMASAAVGGVDLNARMVFGYSSKSNQAGANKEKPKIKIMEKEAVGIDKRIQLLKKEFEAEDRREARLEDSFEEQEKRIRRENLLKDFSLLLSRKWSRTESTSKIALLEYLKKNSKIHEVHCSYACELRDANLKRWLLDLWMQAAEKHRFRTKLVRNFARIFNRLLKPHAEAQMQEGVKAIRAVKKPLHRAGQRAKPKKNSPQKTERSEVAKTQGGGGAGGVLDRIVHPMSKTQTGTSAEIGLMITPPSNVRKPAVPSKSPKTRPAEEKRKEEPAAPAKKEGPGQTASRTPTPVRASRAAKESKESSTEKKQAKQRHSPSKSSVSASLENIGKNLKQPETPVQSRPSKLLKPAPGGAGGSLSAARGSKEPAEPSVSPSKAQASAVSGITGTTKGSAKTSSQSKLPAEQQQTVNPVNSKHQEIKAKLLQQMQADDADEAENGDDHENDDEEEASRDYDQNRKLAATPETQSQLLASGVNHSRLSASQDEAKSKPTLAANNSILGDTLGLPRSTVPPKQVAQPATKPSIFLEDAGEKPNIFFNSVERNERKDAKNTDLSDSIKISKPVFREEEKPAAESKQSKRLRQSESEEEELDPKTDQKLFRLNYRKTFRKKA